MIRHVCVLILGCICLTASSASAQTGEALRWYKGNTHTHTLNSDGDSTPDEVARWYREHRYHFLVLTDHNYLTSVDGLNAVMGADETFLIIKGEEVTDRFGDKPLHINGMNVDMLVTPQGGDSVVDVLQRNVDAIRQANGIPHINHPNFVWAITPQQLKQVERYRLFEIYNGHPQVNNMGGGGVPGLEEIWDLLLSGGKLIYGIAVDDAHHFKRPYDPTAAGPGRGWIMVRAPQLKPEAIMNAIDAGDFYASTGVELSDYRADQNRVAVTINVQPWAKYIVRFIGQDGRVLKETIDNPATYMINGDEGYVRVKIMESSGRVAWTQPVMVRR